MRIPFDSLTLSAVVAEIAEYANAKVQKIASPDAFTVTIELYAAQTRAQLMLTCDPVFARMHFVTRRSAGPPPVPAFCAALRAHLEGAVLLSVKQKGFDRVVTMEFDGPKGQRTIVAELMGKHSNLMLLGPDRRIVSAAKVVGPSKSSRPIIPGRDYEPPPFPPKRPIFEAKAGEDLAGFEGASPFLLKLIEAVAGERGIEPWEFAREIGMIVSESNFHPVMVPGSGAYPISVAALGLMEHERHSISVALEQHFAIEVPRREADQIRNSLSTQLKRVLLAREAALADLGQAASAARHAGDLQLQGELILAYGAALEEGASVLEAEDYSGNPITIRLDPTAGYLENAKRLFEKAKHAKGSANVVTDQIKRLKKDKADLETLMARLTPESDLRTVEEIREEARKCRWLHEQPTSHGPEKERPFEGHKIRELQGPRGYRVLYGENATSNDYLTSRVAKPNDYWLHVRGGTSAHVVILTGNHPEKVGPDVISYAAGVAVQNSVSKHASYVPVDYTLKKYVRKPRGSAPGLAVYEREKTIHIENTNSSRR